MKRHWVCSWLLSLWAVTLAAQKSQSAITVPTEPDPAGGRMALLCCTPSDLAKSKSLCSHSLKFPASTGDLNVPVQILCDKLTKESTAISLDREWRVFPKNGRRVSFGINCDTLLGWPLEEPSVPNPPPPPPASANTPGPTAKTPDPPPPASSDKSGQDKTDKVTKRIKELEKSLEEQQKFLQKLKEELEKQSAADRREFEKKLEALQRDLLDKLRALGESQKNGCYRVDDTYKGRAEVTVAVAGAVLRFLEVKPSEASVSIGLPEAKAGGLLAEVQAQSGTTIFPHIYLAVPEAVRDVQPFFLQDRLIDPDLYSRLTAGKDAGRVSYEDVSRFIEELNARCAGRATFALPTEEQFVAAAHLFYDPVRHELKSCDVLRAEDVRSDVTELLGTSWQLTRSLCQTFSDHPKATCPENSWIRKGGAMSSNPLECMPEYRTPAPFDVQQKETSFRLALKE